MNTSSSEPWKRVARGNAFALLALLALLVPPGLARPEWSREHFGGLRARLAGLSAPAAVAFDREGRVLVTDTGHDRIAVFDPSGTRLALWGGRGTDAGRFLRPAGIAVAPDGRVYVSDTGNHRVQVLDAEGAPLLVFGVRGREPGELCEPLGLSVDAEHVVVADAGNARVQFFDTTGRFVRVLGGLGDADGSFLLPFDVALEPGGRCYVVDALRCRVTRFDAQGRLLAAFGLRGQAPGLLSEPTALDVREGRLFVAERYNHRVQELDPGGAFRATFPGPAFVPRHDEGKLFAPSGLAISPAGDLIAVAEPLEDRVQIFGEAPAHSGAALHADPSGIEDSLARVGDGAGASGSLLALVDPELRAVGVYDLSHVDPVLITRLGALEGAGVRFLAPRDVAIDLARGWLHVSDAGRARLSTFRLQRDAGDPLRFDASMGRLVRTIDFAALPGRGVLDELAWPVRPGALACARDGELFLADERNGAIVVLDPRGQPLRAWTRAGAEHLRRPVELALAAGDAQLFVVDADAGRVHVFDPQGAWLRSLGKPGTKHGGLQEPSGVVVQEDGTILVADRRAECVQVFDSDGAWLRSWGGAGTGPGQMHQPTSVLAGPDGKLYLIDAGNRRGQVLTPQGRFLLNF